MPVTSVAERLASNSLQQHLYAEPTVVAEDIYDPSGCIGSWCLWDWECCYGLICEWWSCIVNG